MTRIVVINKLPAILTERKMSIASLADALPNSNGVKPRNHYNKVLKFVHGDYVSPPLELWAEICQQLKVPPGDVIGFELVDNIEYWITKEVP